MMMAMIAHAGHAGDHGWLTGALQPWLSWDHLYAGVFVVLVVSFGLWLARGSITRTETRGG